jgi:hypothetical protein
VRVRRRAADRRRDVVRVVAPFDDARFSRVSQKARVRSAVHVDPNLARARGFADRVFYGATSTKKYALRRFFLAWASTWSRRRRTRTASRRSSDRCRCARAPAAQADRSRAADPRAPCRRRSVRRPEATALHDGEQQLESTHVELRRNAQLALRAELDVAATTGCTSTKLVAAIGRFAFGAAAPLACARRKHACVLVFPCRRRIGSALTSSRTGQTERILRWSFRQVGDAAR